MNKYSPDGCIPKSENRPNTDRISKYWCINCQRYWPHRIPEGKELGTCMYCGARNWEPQADEDMNETFREQVERVIQMSRDSGETWDLSPNDQAALKAVLLRMSVLDAEVESLLQSMRKIKGENQ